jgi:hypothetical protein
LQDKFQIMLLNEADIDPPQWVSRTTGTSLWLSAKKKIKKIEPRAVFDYTAEASGGAAGAASGGTGARRDTSEGAGGSNLSVGAAAATAAHPGGKPPLAGGSGAQGQKADPVLLEPATAVAFVLPSADDADAAPDAGSVAIASHLKVTNTTAGTVLFKVKTTLPKLYFVKPKAGECVLLPSAGVCARQALLVGAGLLVCCCQPQVARFLCSPTPQVVLPEGVASIEGSGEWGKGSFSGCSTFRAVTFFLTLRAVTIFLTLRAVTFFLTLRAVTFFLTFLAVTLPNAVAVIGYGAFTVAGG